MKKTLPSHLGCYSEKFSQPNKTICPIHFSKMNHSNLKQTNALPFGCFWDAMLLQFLFGMSLVECRGCMELDVTHVEVFYN